MFTGGAINWSTVFNTASGGCGLYEKTLSYVDSGWEVKVRNFSSYECEICPEGEHPDMDSLMSVLVRIHSMYPDIWKAYIHVRDRENYICTMDGRFQICTPDEVSTLAMFLIQIYQKAQWDSVKKQNSLKSGEDEG